MTEAKKGYGTCIKCGFNTRTTEEGYPCTECVDYDHFRPEEEWDRYTKP